MFDRAQTVEPADKGIRLLGAESFNYELEESDCLLILQSTELTVRAGIEWPFRGHRDENPEEPRVRRYINGSMSEVNSRTFAFRGTKFLGAVRRITLECHESSKDYIKAMVWTPDENMVDETTLHIVVTLKEDHFKETFHPIWLRQAKSTLDLTIDCKGFQWGPEASFGEVGDQRHYVLDGSRVVEAAFSSIYLRTSLGVSPPRLPTSQR
ncbi:hypothetical protein QA633_26400 [Bradyrhizobium barranii]|uniref:hypothetical protein n=1 Tax=Bradyrhizobium TaxID=374 RepID=UPI0024AFE47D|nr:hypothetical protein [Bradyrhizobium barranii]WFT91884.1 hypothetical protein QA633_26400 [Bradyrhizobium barranii]